MSGETRQAKAYRTLGRSQLKVVVPEGGTINFRFSTHTSHSDLHNYIRMVKSVHRPKDGFFLRAESFFNVASDIERLDATSDDE